MENKKQPIVPPTVYTEAYYLTDNEGYKEYQKGLDGNIHPKFSRALRYAKLQHGMRVLDLGCGRGELSFYALKCGCFVTAVDYSEAAIRIAKQTMEKLEGEARARLDLRLLDATGLGGLLSNGGANSRFDVVFMVDVMEHVYPWQLREIVSYLQHLIKPEGVLFISTPNRLYEHYFYTFKRIISFPFTVLQMLLRLLRGKITAKEFFPRILKFSMRRNEAEDQIHINLMSPGEIRAHFPGWRMKITCGDSGASKSFLNFLAGPWFGPEMIVCAKPPLQ